MTSPIDPIRRPGAPRRANDKVDPVRRAKGTDSGNLPVVVDPQPEPPRPPAADPAPAGAVFAAQLLGQDGHKRGLRGGPATLDAAKSTYNSTEWSGAADRRSRKGRSARTEI
jgi:hypothetical protein